MQANNTQLKNIRLMDYPYLPWEIAIARIEKMPEGFGAAIAKLCYDNLNKKLS